jgi:diguanylate cyclase (GGDEF)-like protein
MNTPILQTRALPIQVLVLEDDPVQHELVRLALEGTVVGIHPFYTPEAAVEALRCGLLVDAAIVDLDLADSSGSEAVDAVNRVAPGVPILVVSQVSEAKAGLVAVRAGAEDFVSKDRLDRLGRTLEYVVERGRSRRQLAFYRSSDPLTELPNAATFRALVEAALSRKSQDVGLILVNLTRLKSVNDRFGRLAGDAVVRAFAKRLRSCVPPGWPVGRIDGDEFGVLIPKCSGRDWVAEFAHRLAAVGGEPLPAVGRSVVQRATYGCAVASDTAGGLEGLWRAAETALRQARGQGGGVVRSHDAAMEDVIQRLLWVETALLAPDITSQMHAVYQPIVGLNDRRIVGREALLRWESPELGSVPPNVFIKLAEEMGRICQIGEFVFERACESVAAHLEHGYVSVNVSPVQLHDPEFLGGITRILEKTGVLANRIVLEVTESVLVRDPDAVAALMAACRALGFRTAIDDFGTGHSSLSYLSRLPFDILKIDRTFVERSLVSRVDARIIEGVTALARSLNIELVAEGIETEAQFEYLRHLGCQYGQGYLFSRPTAHALPDADAVYPVSNE